MENSAATLGFMIRCLFSFEWSFIFVSSGVQTPEMDHLSHPSSVLTLSSGEFEICDCVLSLPPRESENRSDSEGLLWCPVMRVLHFHCRGRGFNSWSGN